MTLIISFWVLFWIAYKLQNKAKPCKTKAKVKVIEASSSNEQIANIKQLQAQAKLRQQERKEQERIWKAEEKARQQKEKKRQQKELAEFDSEFCQTQLILLQNSVLNTREKYAEAVKVCQEDEEKNDGFVVVSDEDVKRHIKERDKLLKSILALEKQIYNINVKMMKNEYVLNS